MSSLYEKLYPLSTIMKQHFVENFSGSVLDTDRWNLGGTNTPTAIMSDTINGGVKVTTGGSINNFATLTFNNIEPFDATSCVIIFVSTRDNTNAKSRHGLSHLGATAEAFTEHHAFVNNGETPEIKFETGNGTNSSTDSGVTATLNTVLNKIEMSSSNGKYFFDGVLKVTKTTNLPTTSQQPYLYHFAQDGAARSINYRYCEAWNN